MGVLRGIIDGDGCVGKTGKIISIVSASENFIDDIVTVYGGKKEDEKVAIIGMCFFTKMIYLY